MFRSVLSGLLAFIFISTHAQLDDSIIKTPADTLNDYLISYLENNDMGFLWSGEISQDERLGFIGADYQRIEVRFISVIQNFDNPFEYFIYGKTRVKNTVCDFQGSLMILEAGIEKSREHPGFSTAWISGDFVFFEDQDCMHSGVFRGEFVSFIYAGNDGVFYYNDLDVAQGSYSNNQFTGNWYDYRSDLVQPSNWGDRRIPGSADLDIGLDGFKPSYRYLGSGWQEYIDQKASGKETDMPWWK